MSVGFYGPGTNQGTTGNNGGSYGGGASGGVRQTAPAAPVSGGTSPGGTGATGVVIIEEFY